mmetsp:Transcript_19129/g.25695  ORF Transcript_19129/g.25695 Transcript_19129/m.25695 type:complete len:143 (-) Transcript_19129:105-533(-)
MIPWARRVLLEPHAAVLQRRWLRPVVPPALLGSWARAAASQPGVAALCDAEELARRDAARAGDRAAYEGRCGKQVSLGDTLDRQIYVANLRTKDGRRRVPKLMMLDSEGHKWMSLTEEDFEAIVKFLPKIKTEIIKYQKKLS